MRTEHTIQLTLSDLDFLLRCAAKLAIELVEDGAAPDEAREAAVKSLLHSLGLYYRGDRAMMRDVPEAFRRFIESLGDD